MIHVGRLILEGGGHGGGGEGGGHGGDTGGGHGGDAGGSLGVGAPRKLDQTPTWAVASVCAVIIVISILLEKVLHHIGEWFTDRRKKAMFEALEKVKAELMILGFISLLLTFGQNYIAGVCIPETAANTMLPCSSIYEVVDPKPKKWKGEPKENGGHRRLLMSLAMKLSLKPRRFLSGGEPKAACPKGHVPLVSNNALHQLHIFIFFLALLHVFFSAITMSLGRAKQVPRWRIGARLKVVSGGGTLEEDEPMVGNDDIGSLGLWQAWKVEKVHLSLGSKFDFQKYIKRSLEDDFKVVVGISQQLLELLSLHKFDLLTLNKGWYTLLWISIMPLIIILSVGTKLQAIISMMAIEIKERHAVVQGIPLVQYEFGLESCFNPDLNLIIARVCLGAVVEFLCSYITLPLYALVSQMGSQMKQSIFDEQTSKALKKWHQAAKKKNVKESANSPTRSPASSPKAVYNTQVKTNGNFGLTKVASKRRNNVDNGNVAETEMVTSTSTDTLPSSMSQVDLLTGSP
ncbi:hypothetical protein HPP92_005135 [Vanilla planifolia]|uniref:MLO-like protein n=1 Tax=Vanilla planifolia TaxID=51239 RepID=A0A835VF34_VANPL|nr:hypothetical protein HPP92_005135 [Vanilla planifolia]